jgi:hypothetical protein
MTKPIEALEEQFDVLRREEEKLIWLFKMRDIKEHNYYTKKATQSVNLHFPNLAKQCKELIEDCAVFTEAHGGSDRLDFIKELAWRLLGHTQGDKL